VDDLLDQQLRIGALFEDLVGAVVEDDREPSVDRPPVVSRLSSMQPIKLLLGYSPNSLYPVQPVAAHPGLGLLWKGQPAGQISCSSGGVHRNTSHAAMLGISVVDGN
jgi:hypothetical protein